MSSITANSVLALMLTVPGQEPCSWLHDTVTGGSTCTRYAVAISRAMVQAITVSVINGR